MSRSQNEGICLSPTMTPHRVNVKTPDPVDYSLICSSEGMDTKGYDDIVADVAITGTGSVVLNVLYWSPLASSFIPSEPPTQVTLSRSSTIRFNTCGRRFFAHISGGAVGAGVTKVEVDAAANILRNV